MPWPFRSAIKTVPPVQRCWIGGCSQLNAEPTFVHHPAFVDAQRVYLCPAHRDLANLGDLSGLVIPDDPKTYWPEGVA